MSTPPAPSTIVVGARGNESNVPIVRAMSRPQFGKAGRSVKLVANFFPMQIPDKLVVHTHSVAIKRNINHTTDEHGKIARARRDTPGAQQAWVDVSQIEPIFFNRNVFDLFLRTEGHNLRTTIAYDGRSIAYSARQLNEQCLNTDVSLTVNEEGIEVPSNADSSQKREVVKVHVQSSSNTLSYADFFRRKDIHREPFLAALDVALANGPSRSHVMVGRSFYSDQNAAPLGRRNVTASAWRGFYQSVRLTQNGFMVNFDESFTAFWNCGGRPLLELIRSANDNRDISCGDRRGIQNLTQRLKLLKVRTTHSGVTYKVHGFTDRNADEITFTNSEGRVTSINQYFSQVYRVQLRYPHLPLVKTHPKRDTFFPIELLEVVNKQRLVGLLQPEQTQSIVRVASTKPQNRMNVARSKMQGLLHKKDSVREDFGINVNPELISLEGRILPPPMIQYRNETAVPANGQWRTRKAAFPAPATLENWVVLINARVQERDVRDFLRDFISAARRGGMDVKNVNPKIATVRGHRVGNEMKIMFEQFKASNKDGLQLMVVINERQDSAVYNEIKRTGDLEMGVVTQVLLAKNISNKRGRSMYCDNVILKVNVKLGGQNSHVASYALDPSSRMSDVWFINTPHIVLGADVTHPMPGGKTCSVAALVGSRDRQGVQFSASIRNQKGRTEIIQHLGDMFKEVYLQWRKNFKDIVDARSIIMFRDGVADGQYEQVLSVELESLRKACEELSQELKVQFRPLITYIIVTKRHHARFFSHDPSALDRSGNIAPGTVVDRTVTSADYYDFYLNSHAGIQGTSKPSKYVVLKDENKIPVDALQGYIYRLSYGFARCNRSVSMVNSAYYAHLLAFRGRAYLSEESEGGSSRVDQSHVMPTARIDPYLQRRLFWV